MTDICSKCGRNQTKAILMIVSSYCWKCGEAMKVAIVQGGVDRNAGGSIGPDEFSPLELSIAKEQGALIKEQYSKTMNESYLANTCTHCNNFVGNSFLHKDHLFPASIGHLEYEIFEGETYCEFCTEANFQESLTND